MNTKALIAWASEGLAQFIEGASDSFLIVMGGNTAKQLASGTAEVVTPKGLACAMLVGGAIYAASYFKKNHMPTDAATASIPPAT